jgi:AcrR family transcriptional regulator
MTRGDTGTTAQGSLRERKNAAVKRAFFEAAAALFREKGYDATSVDEIAERAGYSRATFFNHFGTKERVMSYYHRFFASRVEELLDELDPQASPLERIRQTLAAMVGEAERRREDLKVIYLYRGKDPNYLGGLTEARRGILERMTALVGEAQGRAELRRDLAAKELAYHILAVYVGFMTAVIVDGIPSDRALQSGWRFILEGARGSGTAEEGNSTGGNVR